VNGRDLFELAFSVCVAFADAGGDADAGLSVPAAFSPRTSCWSLGVGVDAGVLPPDVRSPSTACSGGGGVFDDVVVGGVSVLLPQLPLGGIGDPFGHVC
jgi:hypothetical protein